MRGVLHAPAYPIPHEDDRLELRHIGEPAVVEHPRHPVELHLPARGLRGCSAGDGGAAVPSPAPTDAVANMAMIDAAYEKAGMPPRQPAAR